VDIARPSSVARQKRVRRIAYGAAGVVAILLITLGLSRLKPAAPSVDRGTLVIDTVKHGGMLRQVRGLGTLVPEDFRWIPAATEGRVERIVVLPGSNVSADTVILELSNPELEMQAADAESQLRQAEASFTELKVRLQSQHLDQEAAAASVQADYAQAQMRADRDEQLAQQGLVADLDRRISRMTSDQLANRNKIEQQRLAIAAEAIKAQLDVQRAQVEQKRVLARLRRDQVKAQAVRAGIGACSSSPGRGRPAGQPRHHPGQGGRAEPPEGGHPGGGDPGQGRPDRADCQHRYTQRNRRRTRLTCGPRVPERDGDCRRGAQGRAAQGRAAGPQRGRDDRAGAAGEHPVRRPAAQGGQGPGPVGLFKLEEGTRVTVRLGRSSVSTVEVIEGLKEGDQVVLSDTTAYDAVDRIRIN
jgi:HlyD family secretion protein